MRLLSMALIPRRGTDTLDGIFHPRPIPEHRDPLTGALAAVSISQAPLTDIPRRWIPGQGIKYTVSAELRPRYWTYSLYTTIARQIVKTGI